MIKSTNSDTDGDQDAEANGDQDSNGDQDTNGDQNANGWAGPEVLGWAALGWLTLQLGWLALRVK